MEVIPSQPIFICGYPKSGTTLLPSLLDGHSQLLVYPEETQYFRRIHNHPTNQTISFLLEESTCSRLKFDCFGHDGKQTHTSLNSASAENVRNYQFVDWNKFEEIVRADFDSAKASQQILPLIMKAYAKAIGREKYDYWIEKTVSNELYLEEAFSLWPKLKAIYVLRDPRDVFTSYRKKQARGKTVLSLQQFFRHWKRSIKAWERFAAKHPSQSLTIQFEQLASDPEGTIQRVIDFLEIPFEPTLLVPTFAGDSWQGNSMHHEKFSGISTAPIGRFREQLTLNEIAAIEWFFQEEFNKYSWEKVGATVSTLGHLATIYQDWRTKRTKLA